MAEFFSIGELARRSGKSIHALRYYERRGLMPFVARDGGGRRVFQGQHVDWLVLLDRLQGSGMTLAEMHDYASLVKGGKRTIDQRIALLGAHLDEIDTRLRDLTASRALVVGKISFYQQWKSSGKRPPWP